jgi:hypothetical protein
MLDRDTAIANRERPEGVKLAPAAPQLSRLMQLQATAGNQAVVALLQQSRTLSRAAITASVGRGGVNNAPDVSVVQSLLEQAGLQGTDLGGSIERYQRDTMGWRHPDGRVDPHGKTLRKLNEGGGGATTDASGTGAAAAAGPAAAGGAGAGGAATAGPAAASGAGGAGATATGGGGAAAGPAATGAEAAGAAAAGPAAASGAGAAAANPAAASGAGAAAANPTAAGGAGAAAATAGTAGATATTAGPAAASAAGAAGAAPAGAAGAQPEGAEETFRSFAESRAPLLAAMQAAAEGDDRRAARQALRAYDAQHLPTLRSLQAQMGGQWNIQDPAARDAVLAAIQLEAACDAEGDLLNNSEAVHRRVAQASGMGLDSAWCGMFTVNHFLHSGMDEDLKSGFLHVDNVHDYFTYRHTRNPKRVPKWIWADHAWHDLHEYHLLRGAERTWLDQATVGAGGNLDIRAGDVVLIDVGRDGTANHIVKASSYDPATGVLLTIGGNDGGFIIDQRAPNAATGNEATAEAATGQNLKAGGWDRSRGAAGGHVGVGVQQVQADGRRPGAVFGVGRPSIVDFEQHPYDRSGNIRRPPAPLRE